jgi:hypothetical protein
MRFKKRRTKSSPAGRKGAAVWITSRRGMEFRNPNKFLKMASEAASSPLF